jgi:hypothetical protein
MNHQDLHAAENHDTDDLDDFLEIDLDDERWETFLADEDERDPQPEHGDFWPGE